MPLKEKIQSELKSFLKNGKSFEVGVFRMILASIKNKEIEKRTRLHRDFGGQARPSFAEQNLGGQAKLSEDELIKKLEEMSKLTDEEIIDVISCEAKKRKEAILEYEKGKRQELAEKEKKELGILEKYLPEQLSEEEIRKLVEEAIKKTNAREPKEMGRVMAELMPKIKGRADGRVANRIVKEFLTPKTE